MSSLFSSALKASRLIPTCRACTRSYASRPTVSRERALEILANPKCSRRGNPIDDRKLFLGEIYDRIIASRVVFIVQEINLNSPDSFAFKRACIAKGFDAMSVRRGQFGSSAARHAIATNRPAIAQIRHLLGGPCMAVSSSATDDVAPSLLKDFIDIAAKHKGKVMIVGAKFDGVILTADTLATTAALPSMKALREELVALLGMPAQSLVGVLNRAPQALVGALDQHAKALEGKGADGSA
ncbi:hypothetical protein BDK51DRAFT_32724 [Blyttiomyces helicus]|uniref:50S ribosomal protein L10 n=1 Tax=Blyttiomyces helicus TaxID=388810 RepID=A0A4P9VZT5_9FUNG|nr:hypothetical protein BDK51DRAFT_32724 [Blyttiomyces helicus]|eukprot:RKO84862.1 hypothetical protein BDK51DRAFT_32724 [Blyttiomyces helicus]